MILYLITNRINGWCYLGYTSQTVAQRWSRHLQSAARSSRVYFHCAIRKYGPDTFDLSEVCYATGLEQIRLLEQSAIAAFRDAGIPLYNRTDGGEGTHGFKFSTASRAKMRSAKAGKPLSSEHCAALSVAQQKRPRKSPEECAAISKRLLGHPVSEESRLKNRLSHLGKRHSPESNKKKGDWTRGKPWTPARRAAYLRAFPPS